MKMQSLLYKEWMMHDGLSDEKTEMQRQRSWQKNYE
jgi:hypothetical protein